jgi:hypothetical protein
MFVLLLLEMGMSVMTKFFDGRDNEHDHLEVTIQLFAQNLGEQINIEIILCFRSLIVIS